MEELNKYTPTELLTMINKVNEQHTLTKNLIIQLTIELDKLENEINNNINKINLLENDYVELIGELNSR